MNISLPVLQEIVSDYFYAEEEYRLFMRSWVPGWWECKTAAERENYTKYDCQRDSAWDAVRSACRLIGADLDVVVAIMKSIARYFEIKKECKQTWKIRN